MIKRKQYLQIGVYTWVVIEAIWATIAMVAAFNLTPASIANAGPAHVRMLPAVAIYAMALVATSHALGLHNNLNLGSRSRTAVLSALSVIIAVTVSSSLISTALYQQIGRIILLICTILSLACCLAIRLLVRWRISITPYRVRVIGSSFLMEYLRRVVDGSFNSIEIEASDTSLSSVNEIVVENCRVLSASEKSLLLEEAGTGVQVSTATSFIERNFYRIPCEFVTAEWIFSIDFRHQHPYYNDLKRVCDVLMAIFGLVASSPLMLLAFTAIAVEGRGPIFYSQVRIGLFQRPFRIWKLRTMHIESETKGPQWAKVRDSRVTKVGRILRKTRLDEVPQFWNILRGDMAFVGPRPERPEFVRLLNEKIPFYKERHLVKPGLTGWAQISYPYGASEADAKEKLGFDFYYVKNATFMLDLQIVLQTVGAIAKGAR